ncbi:hypothetical protein ACQKFL_11770 [Vreelandella titanicae]|uniref:hypothetical protein n=1 Tax=Vreelandella titanicae TaxID=664683 RepID=UPI003D03E21C
MIIGTHWGAYCAGDDVHAQLCTRNDDLEAEKRALIEENDALAAENEKLRLEIAEQAKQLSTMRCA